VLRERLTASYHNARWYDPALGHFAQADTVVPDGVQGALGESG